MTYSTIYGTGDWADSIFLETATGQDVNDVIGTVLGDKLGRGITREVFAIFGSETLVAKIEKPRLGYFQNVHEFRLWDAAKDEGVSEWLAPCHALSLGGLCLIMGRTRPMLAKDLPSEIPAFLSDTKRENWGMLGEGKNARPVCHDYGIHRAFHRGLTGKLVKHDWD